EDGIRDRTVTGVQTCALPISKVVVTERKLTGSRMRTLTATWPAIVIEALRAALPEISAESPTIPTTRRKTGKKIVVIDDTEMLLIFVEDVLATAEPEWQITTARNAADGLSAIERIEPELALLDYSLP